MRLDINHELNILHASFEKVVRPLWPESLPYPTDNSFRPSNWLVTFPYNFMSSMVDDSENLVRKLAVANALYLTFFLREDDILDEYHLPGKQYCDLLLHMCNAHSFRNLALGQLLNMCGRDVFSYIYEYERKYYNALIWEKSQRYVTLESMLDSKNLKWLGDKLLPLTVTYAGFCVKQGLKHRIKTCEDLLFHYHIAKQLADDLNDLAGDLVKPDGSYLIKACEQSLGLSTLSQVGITEALVEGGFDKKIQDAIVKNLEIARRYAKQLDFHLFECHIEAAEEKVRKISSLLVN